MVGIRAPDIMPGWLIPRAAARTSAAATAPGRPGRRAFGGFAAVSRRRKNRKLNGVLGARAFRTGDLRLPVHHDPLVVLTAIIANVFVNRHLE